jgi:cytochrome bd-type quinol oxidase subunit 2
MYQWIVLLHIVGAFLFVISHGASAWVVVALRGETDPRRIRALADLSSTSLVAAYIGLLLLLIGGIWAGIYSDWFKFGWIWAALAVFIAVAVAMYAIATPYFKRLRIALGQRVQGMPKDAPEPSPAPDAEIVAIAATAPANPLVIVGLGGLLIILWLMVLKPF